MAMLNNQRVYLFIYSIKSTHQVVSQNRAKRLQQRPTASERTRSTWWPIIAVRATVTRGKKGRVTDIEMDSFMNNIDGYSFIIIPTDFPNNWNHYHYHYNWINNWIVIILHFQNWIIPFIMINILSLSLDLGIPRVPLT